MAVNVKLETDARVLRVTLDRPEKRNALRVEDCLQLVAAFNEADLNQNVGAILLSATGPDFCSGMDLSEALHPDAPERAAIHEELFTIGGRINKPVVAAVQGRALAGGLGLVTNSHVVVAAEDAGFGLVEIRIGLWPFVAYRSVSHAIGERRTMELSLTGRVISAREALGWSLTHYVVPATELEERSLAIARALAGSSPEALRRGLEYAHRSRALSQKEAVALAEQLRRRSFRSDDFREGVTAFFDKRAPQWPSLKASVR
jgi:methylglutaconyl-CoA hydratase